MTVKIFQAYDTEQLEKEINEWLATARYRVISHVTQSRGARTLLEADTIVVCIWYE